MDYANTNNRNKFEDFDEEKEFNFNRRESFEDDVDVYPPRFDDKFVNNPNSSNYEYPENPILSKQPTFGVGGAKKEP